MQKILGYSTTSQPGGQGSLYIERTEPKRYKTPNVISEKLPELESIMNERTLFSSGNKSIRSTQPTETCSFQSGGGCKTIKLCIGSDRQALNGCIGGVKLKYRLLV